MIRSISVLLISGMVLSGCGSVRDSGLNPFNWFGRSAPSTVDADANVNPLIPRKRRSLVRPEKTYQGRPVGDVTDVTVERIPGGAIIRATGIADRQGPYEVQLTKDDAGSSGNTMSYVFNVVTARGAAAGGSAASRRVTVATYLTEKELAGIRRIRVSGARNARESTRR